MTYQPPSLLIIFLTKRENLYIPVKRLSIIIGASLKLVLRYEANWAMKLMILLKEKVL